MHCLFLFTPCIPKLDRRVIMLGKPAMEKDVSITLVGIIAKKMEIVMAQPGASTNGEILKSGLMQKEEVLWSVLNADVVSIVELIWALLG